MARRRSGLRAMSSTAAVPLPSIEPDDAPEDTGVSPRRWTRADYYRAADLGLFREGERLELIKGELIQKVSPQRTVHSVGVSKTVLALQAAFGAGFYVRSQLPMVIAEDTEPEPDVLVVPGTPDDYLDEHPTIPDALLVVEVSDTTLGYDRGRKSVVYAEAGVSDYWILDLRGRRLEVRRDPIPLPHGERFAFGYRVVTIYLEGDEATPLAAASAAVKVSDLLPNPATGGSPASGSPSAG